MSLCVYDFVLLSTMCCSSPPVVPVDREARLGGETSRPRSGKRVLLGVSTADSPAGGCGDQNPQRPKSW